MSDVDGFSQVDLPQLIEQSPLILTPKRAKELQKYDVYLRQRNKTEKRLAFISDLIRKKLWHGNKIAVAELEFDYLLSDGSVARTLIVNGGHTLQCHIDNLFTTYNNVYQRWNCKTKAAVTLLFNQFDRSESTRSAADQCKAALDLMPEVEKWEVKDILHKCSIAVSIAERGFSYRNKMSVTDRVNLLNQPKWYPHAAFLRDFLFNVPNFLKEYRHMMKPPVLSSIIETHCIDSEACEKFWEGVKTGAGLMENSPQLALKNFLLEQTVHKHGGGSSFDHWLIKARCHQAWNLWCLNKSIKNFRGKPPQNMPHLVDVSGAVYVSPAANQNPPNKNTP